MIRMKTVSFGPRGFPCGVGTHGSMPPSLPGLLGALRGLDEVVSAKNLFITHTERTISFIMRRWLIAFSLIVTIRSYTPNCDY